MATAAKTPAPDIDIDAIVDRLSEALVPAAEASKNLEAAKLEALSSTDGSISSFAKLAAGINDTFTKEHCVKIGKGIAAKLNLPGSRASELSTMLQVKGSILTILDAHKKIIEKIEDYNDKVTKKSQRLTKPNVRSNSLAISRALIKAKLNIKQLPDIIEQRRKKLMTPKSERDIANRLLDKLMESRLLTDEVGSGELVPHPEARVAFQTLRAMINGEEVPALEETEAFKEALAAALAEQDADDGEDESEDPDAIEEETPAEPVEGPVEAPEPETAPEEQAVPEAAPEAPRTAPFEVLDTDFQTLLDQTSKQG